MFVMWWIAFAPVAKSVVVEMSADDTGHGNEKKQEWKPAVVKLFQHKEKKANGKDRYGKKGPVVFNKPMKQGIRTDDKGQGNHAPFKKAIVNDVNAKNRECCYKDGQQRTVDGTKHRGGDANSVPVHFYIHTKGKNTKMQYCCKK